MKFKFNCLIPFIWCVGLVNASNEEKIPKSEFIYDLELVTGITNDHAVYFGEKNKDIALFFDVILDIEYKDFFLESKNKNRTSGVLANPIIGYHLWHDDNQRIDIIGSSYISPIDKNNANGEPIVELQNLKSRNFSFDLGFRYEHVLDDLYFSSEIVYDVIGSAHKSFIVDSYFGRVLSISNWDINYGIGHTWFSRKTTNYYLGVTQSEIVNDWKQYQTNAGYTINFELSFYYPLSENWIFESALGYRWLSDNLSESPLILQNRIQAAYVGFGYVF